MKRKERVYEFLRRMKTQYGSKNEYSAMEVADAIGITRSNASYDLNRLLEEKLVEKSYGRPVLYKACATVITPVPTQSETSLADNIVKYDYIFLCFSPEWTPPHLASYYRRLIKNLKGEIL